jgi:hypothetical protein
MAKTKLSVDKYSTESTNIGITPTSTYKAVVVKVKLVYMVQIHPLGANTTEYECGSTSIDIVATIDFVN